jgi:plastocyanin
MVIDATTRRRVLGAFVVGAALAAAALATARAAGDAAVKIDNFTFEPQQLTVKAGTTVTWINEDDIPHNIVSSNRTFRSKALDTDDKFSFTFTTPGSYEYFCGLHSYMKATITVSE